MSEEKTQEPAGERTVNPAEMLEQELIRKLQNNPELLKAVKLLKPNENGLPDIVSGFIDSELSESSKGVLRNAEPGVISFMLGRAAEAAEKRNALLKYFEGEIVRNSTKFSDIIHQGEDQNKKKNKDHLLSNLQYSDMQPKYYNNLSDIEKSEIIDIAAQNVGKKLGGLQNEIVTVFLGFGMGYKVPTEKMQNNLNQNKQLYGRVDQERKKSMCKEAEELATTLRGELIRNIIQKKDNPRELSEKSARVFNNLDPELKEKVFQDCQTRANSMINNELKENMKKQLRDNISEKEGAKVFADALGGKYDNLRSFKEKHPDSYKTFEMLTKKEQAEIIKSCAQDINKVVHKEFKCQLLGMNEASQNDTLQELSQMNIAQRKKILLSKFTPKQLDFYENVGIKVNEDIESVAKSCNKEPKSPSRQQPSILRHAIQAISDKIFGTPQEQWENKKKRFDKQNYNVSNEKIGTLSPSKSPKSDQKRSKTNSPGGP